MPAHRCPECDAEYSSETDSCRVRFEQLLALDHSRREPWGSRHGQAFAAFALQHPQQHPSSVDAAWTALYRIYCQQEPAAVVFGSMRASPAESGRYEAVPPRRATPTEFPRVTIADLQDFAAACYAERLNEWCRASLRVWGADIAVHGA